MPASSIAPPPVSTHTFTSPRQKIKEKRKLIIIVACIIIGLLFILKFIVEPFDVDGISMQPTLHSGNIVLVWRFPQTWASITHGQYIPGRSNLVVIQKTPVSGEQLIKRVIGVPGDTIRINNNLLVINTQHPDGFNPDTAPYGAKLLAPLGIFNSQVGDGQIFVMGDNRAPGASIDSRSSLGNIPSQNIIGKVVIRIYPFNKIKLF